MLKDPGGVRNTVWLLRILNWASSAVAANIPAVGFPNEFTRNQNFEPAKDTIVDLTQSMYLTDYHWVSLFVEIKRVLHHR